MPIYEYMCPKCHTLHEAYRRMEKRHVAMICPNGHKADLVSSVPALSIWDADRPFLNAVKFGDGKFPTKKAYESHLKANDMAEARTDGKIYRPHGNRVIHGAAQAKP